MMIPECFLPSKPSQKVCLREASVADSIDFCNTHADAEELATSLFLERVQEKSSYSDPRAWTADDRRFVLFWYWAHTTAAHDKAIPFKYPCSHCGKSHAGTATVEGLIDGLKEIQGKAERDIAVGDHAMTVVPLNGHAMEELEEMQMMYTELCGEYGKKAKEARAYHAKIRLARILHVIRFPFEKNAEDVERREKELLKIPFSLFGQLREKIEGALVDMEHGLHSVYKNGKIVLISERQVCPEHPEKEGMLVHIPFWTEFRVPQI